MNLIDALISQDPSLELQRAAHTEICRLRAEVERLRDHAVVLANTEREVERERWIEAVMAELDGNGQAHAIVACATGGGARQHLTRQLDAKDEP